MKQKNPILFQVNTRVFLNEISRRINRRATLDDIPDEKITGWSNAGFDWIYLLSVWQTGEAGRQISRTNPIWRREFEETLIDLEEQDIVGSGFAIKGYEASDAIGGAEALQRFRKRIAARGMKLMLDFVPNHMAPDHPWVQDHPDYFIRGAEADINRAPENFARVRRTHDELILAYGRDPYFSGWPDTIQLNYGNHHLQEAMKKQLLHVATQCDGLRCDMAMLLLTDVFNQTWGIGIDPFWPDANRRVKVNNPGFVMMGEVYWDLGYEMQQQGFDYTYDKRLYDRLLTGEATPVRDHLKASLDYQEKLARFLENHDEQRAASVFPWEAHQAAAILTFLTPGLKFFHRGEFQGHKVKVSPNLGRGPDESPNPLIDTFYKNLLKVLNRPLFHEGDWCLVEPLPAWDDNPTYINFIAFTWSYQDELVLAIVNYASFQGQSRIRPPLQDLKGYTLSLQDLIHDEAYQRDGTELSQTGLYVDLPGWGFHLFEITKAPPAPLKGK